MLIRVATVKQKGKQLYQVNIDYDDIFNSLAKTTTNHLLITKINFAQNTVQHFQSKKRKTGSGRLIDNQAFETLNDQFQMVWFIPINCLITVVKFFH